MYDFLFHIMVSGAMNLNNKNATFMKKWDRKLPKCNIRVKRISWFIQPKNPSNLMFC